ncbi:unnamed protein product [Caenorhabditis brenneri]
MSGPASKRQRTTFSFEIEDEYLSDLCIIVQDVKFYVLKQHLIMHSDYFKAMFSGSFVESNKKEIVLHDVKDPKDFRRFLEIINGVECLKDNNIDGVSLLADMLCAEIVQDRCLDFLNEKSMMPAREKFEIAVKYDFMKELKADIISNIRTPEELKDVIPDIDELDEETSKMFLKKSIALHRAPPAPIVNNPPQFSYAPQLNYPAGYYVEARPFVPHPQFRNELNNGYHMPMNNNAAPAPHHQNQLQDPVAMNDERLQLLNQAIRELLQH